MDVLKILKHNSDSIVGKTRQQNMEAPAEKFTAKSLKRFVFIAALDTFRDLKKFGQKQFYFYRSFHLLFR